MPFVLITVGLVLFAVALNSNGPNPAYKQFAARLYSDVFTSNPSFIKWALALVAVGFIGYIPGWKKPADWFMFLIIIGMVLANGGLFTQLEQAIQAGPATAGSTGTTGATTIGTTTLQGLANQASGSLIGSAEQGLLFSNPITGGIAVNQLAASGLGSDTPNLTDADFAGLTDAQIIG
jgi:nucleoside recognition membrane protein YjiH